MKVQQSPQLAKLLPALDAEEAAVLRERMLADRTPQVFPYAAINGTNYQLDGHHRLPICVAERIKYSWLLIEGVTTLGQAIEWVKQNQEGRRNLTPEQKLALRRERVQQMYLDGMGTRAIAEAEGVSQSTAARDIKAFSDETTETKPNPSVSHDDSQKQTTENKPNARRTPVANGSARKGERKKRQPKPFSLKEWESRVGYVRRGIEDMARMCEERAGQNEPRFRGFKTSLAAAVELLRKVHAAGMSAGQALGVES